MLGKIILAIGEGCKGAMIGMVVSTTTFIIATKILDKPIIKK
jgi:hypothetical protein